MGFPDTTDESILWKLDNLYTTSRHNTCAAVTNLATLVDDVVTLSVNLKFVGAANVPGFWKSVTDTLWNLNKVALASNLKV